MEFWRTTNTFPWHGSHDMIRLVNAAKYKFTTYFENEVLRKRPYIKKVWCIQIVEAPEKVERQDQNRYRFWGRVPEFQNKYFRVITLDDKTTIHNVFPDRGYKP
jgi:hypothetical protein